jgi:hypothetical protein
MRIKKQDLWDLDYTISKFILRHLKAFRKMKRCGCPALHFSTMEDWNNVLDKMIFAFENDLKDDLDLGRSRFIMQKGKLDKKGWNAYRKKVEEGLDLFWKYRKFLWD